MKFPKTLEECNNTRILCDLLDCHQREEVCIGFKKTRILCSYENSCGQEIDKNKRLRNRCCYTCPFIQQLSPDQCWSDSKHKRYFYIKCKGKEITLDDIKTAIMVHKLQK